jgi:hypothetical protein
LRGFAEQITVEHTRDIYVSDSPCELHYGLRRRASCCPKFYAYANYSTCSIALARAGDYRSN